VAKSFHMFNANELEEGEGQLMDPWVGAWNVFTTMRATLGLFKMLTNFTLVEFDELEALMLPTIVSHEQSIGGYHNLASN
jgi:hypothetical protein